MLDKIKRNKGALLFLVVVSLILILPPIIHQYPYPNFSDDTPCYLQVVEKVADGDLTQQDSYIFFEQHSLGSFWSYHYRYAAPATVGLIARMLNSDPYWTFYAFHYLSLILIAGCLYLFCFRVFNKTAGILSLFFVLLSTPSLLRFFLFGSVFNLVNLLVFGLMGSLALIYFIKTKRLYYAVCSLALFGVSVLYHSSTGIEIFASVGFFLACYLAYKAFRKQWKDFKAVGLYTTAFCAINGLLLYFLAPESLRLVTNVFNGTSVSSLAATQSPFNLYNFVVMDTNYPLLLIGLIATGYVIINRRILSQVNQLGIWLTGAFILVIGTTMVMGSAEPSRSGQDMSIYLAIVLTGFISIALYSLKHKIKSSKDKWIGVLLIGCMTIPCMTGWFSYNSAIHPIDKEAIAFINSTNGSYSVSTQIQYRIYELFIDNELEDEGGDYIIYRNTAMTSERRIGELYCQVIGNESVEEYYDGLPIAAEFSEGDIEITIYRNE